MLVLASFIGWVFIESLKSILLVIAVYMGIVIAVAAAAQTPKSTMDKLQRALDTLLTKLLSSPKEDNIKGDELPRFTGRLLEKGSPHPVNDGYIPHEVWSSIKSDIKAEPKDTEYASNFQRWRQDYQSYQELWRQQLKDLKKLEKWIDRRINSTSNFVATIEKHEGTEGLQKCRLVKQLLLAKRLPSLCLLDSDKEIERWVSEDLGITELCTLYPFITQKDHLQPIKDLIYDFEYGPNPFDWASLRIPFKLKSEATKLYFVKIDLGGLAGYEHEYVYKVGITKKEVVGSSKKARYAGELTQHIDILRELDFRDGRDAFLREQKVIKYDRKNCLNRTTKKEVVTSDGVVLDTINPIDKSPRKVLSQLGPSEWVFGSLSEEEALSIFDQLTAYSPDFQ